MAENAGPEKGNREAGRTDGARENKAAVNPGLELARKMTPVGCILVLLLFVLYLVTCFTAGNDPLSGYKPPHDAAYYAQSSETMDELKTELEANVFPKLTGVQGCALVGGKLKITLAPASYNDTHAALTRRFDESLFTFETGG